MAYKFRSQFEKTRKFVFWGVKSVELPNGEKMANLHFKRKGLCWLKTPESSFVKIKLTQWIKRFPTSRLRALGNKMRLLEVILKKLKIIEFCEKMGPNAKKPPFFLVKSFSKFQGFQKKNLRTALFGRFVLRRKNRTSRGRFCDRISENFPRAAGRAQMKPCEHMTQYVQILLFKGSTLMSEQKWVVIGI